MSQNEVTTVFRWNGKEYPFDIRDADDAEKFEQASHDMTEAAKNVPKDGKFSSMLRTQCDLIRKFFETCFDEDTAAEILGEKTNLEHFYNAYKALCNAVSHQRDYLIQVKNTFNQFSNRQQRRHPNDGKKGGQNYGKNGGK